MRPAVLFLYQLLEIEWLNELIRCKTVGDIVTNSKLEKLYGLGTAFFRANLVVRTPKSSFLPGCKELQM